MSKGHARSGGNEGAPLIATYMGFEGSEPSNCLRCSIVKGSSLGGARSVRAGCMTDFGSEADALFSSVWGVEEACEDGCCCCLRLRRSC